MNEKKATIYQNLWDGQKAVLKSNLLVNINSLCLKKNQTPQINNKTFYFKKLEREANELIQSKQKEGNKSRNI